MVLCTSQSLILIWSSLLTELKSLFLASLLKWQFFTLIFRDYSHQIQLLFSHSYSLLTCSSPDHLTLQTPLAPFPLKTLILLSVYVIALWWLSAQQRVSSPSFLAEDAMWPGPSNCKSCLSYYSANVWPQKTFLRLSPMFWHGDEKKKEVAKTYCIYEEMPGSNLCSRQVSTLSLYCSPFVLTLGTALPFSPKHLHCI